MDSQSFSMCHAEDQDSLSTRPTEAQFCTTNAADNQIFPIGFSMDPTVIQQHYNLTTPFGSYTQTSSIDVKPAWPTPQQYADPSLQSPAQHGLPPLVPRLSIAKSLVSDEGDDTSEPTSPRDEASERRKERRRAQNRAAQRAFRARKEDTIKESSARLEALQEELIRLQSAHGNLSETVSRLRSENARLRQENATLRCRRADGIGDWNTVEDGEGNLREMVASARSSFDEHEGRLNRFGLGESMLGTVQWRDTGGSKGGGNEDKAVAETVIDAAAVLTRSMF